MKRFIASALIVGVSLTGFVGCDQESTSKKTEEVNTPNGREKVTTQTKVEKSGDAKDTGTSTEAPK
jgi:hypothetical protein